MSWRAVIDRDVCMGSGNCADREPEHFGLDDEYIARVTASGLPDARLLYVARSCPSGAIELFDGVVQVDVFAPH